MRGLRRRHELGRRRPVGDAEEQPEIVQRLPFGGGSGVVERRQEGQYWPALILAIAATAES